MSAVQGATLELPPLIDLDPDEVWKPWQPSPDGPGAWNLKWAAHLFRRAGFGAPPHAAGRSTWEGLQQAVQQGFEATLDRLFTGEENDYDRVMDGLTPGLGHARFDGRSDGALLELQTWWLQRMAFTPNVLRERLTLFWHNHFATSIVKVQSAALMVRQNQLFRRHALGKFQPLLLAVSQDPAMLLWLDSNSNVKGRPNENFGRELLELFTLGPGQYTEQDVREAARAFTGWHVGYAQPDPRDRRSAPYYPDDARKFVFNADQHDYGTKVFQGEKGSWDGGQVIDIVLKQPAAARFLVRKLYRHFISEHEPPPEALLAPLAEQFRRTDYDVASVLRTMLSSRLFFSAHAYRQRIKSPVEFVVGLIRSLDAQTVPLGLGLAFERLGQRLFAPPNVKGWDGGKAWLNSATLLARHNLAWSLIGDGSDTPSRGPGPVDRPLERLRLNPAALVHKHAGQGPAAQAAFLLDLFLQGDVPSSAREQLAGYLAGAPGAPAPRRLRELAHTILLMPEYQLS